jgi:HK97 gp10 family phage protein
MSRTSGFKGARARAKVRPAQLDAKVSDAIQTAVVEVHRAGKENIVAMVRKRTGRLLRYYRKKLTRNGLKGLVGYTSAKGRKDAFYARFVHDGTSKTKAAPYHDLAVLEFEGKHKKRMRFALTDTLDNRAAPSGTARSGGGKERSIG